MTLNPEQIQSMQKAAEPLVKWLNENCHPHCEIIVTTTDARLTEGVASIPVEWKFDAVQA